MGQRTRILRQIPNALTVTRMFLALAFPWVGAASRGPVLFVALLTEYLDGAMARRFGWSTELGKILDPVADKLLYLSVVLTFLSEGRIGWLAVGALGVRDIVVTLCASVLVVRRRWGAFRHMAPNLFGKATTALQYVAFFVVALGYRLHPVLLTAVFALGALASAQYVASYFQAREVARPEREPEIGRKAG